jgi:RecG-like helicase
VDSLLKGKCSSPTAQNAGSGQNPLRFGRLSTLSSLFQGTVSVLVSIYHVLREQKAYQELGGTYFDEHDRRGIEKRLVRRLEKLGYEVSLTATSPAP